MTKTAIRIEKLSKQYRLGLVGTGTLSHDLKRWYARTRGKEDPYLKVSESNDRTVTGDSQYVWALKDINIDVNEGEVLGIIGKNGAGKSTLLKILSRVTGPTVGSIKVRGRIGSLLEVGTGFHPELTGRENIFLNGAILGMTRVEIQSKIDQIVDFSGTSRYIDTPVKRYSSGMKVRLAFSVAAHLEPEVLVVDEVLAVGDSEFQRKAIGKIDEVSKVGRTVLFVSHNMESISKLCSRCLVMDKGQVTFDGTPKEAISQYLDRNLVRRNELFQNLSSEMVNRRGTGQIRFSKIQMLNSRDNYSLDGGDKCEFLMSIERDRDDDSLVPYIDVLVKDNQERILFKCDSRFAKVDSRQLGNSSDVKLSINPMPLLSGEYVVDFFIKDNGKAIDAIENQFFVRINESNNFEFLQKMPNYRASPILVSHSYECL